VIEKQLEKDSIGSIIEQGNADELMRRAKAGEIVALDMETWMRACDALTVIRKGGGANRMADMQRKYDVLLFNFQVLLRCLDGLTGYEAELMQVREKAFEAHELFKDGLSVAAVAKSTLRINSYIKMIENTWRIISHAIDTKPLDEINMTEKDILAMRQDMNVSPEPLFDLLQRLFSKNTTNG
jgi:hypothetical protein